METELSIQKKINTDTKLVRTQILVAIFGDSVIWKEHSLSVIICGCLEEQRDFLSLKLSVRKSQGREVERNSSCVQIFLSSFFPPFFFSSSLPPFAPPFIPFFLPFFLVLLSLLIHSSILLLSGQYVCCVLLESFSRLIVLTQFHLLCTLIYCYY